VSVVNVHWPGGAKLLDTAELCVSGFTLCRLLMLDTDEAHLAIAEALWSSNNVDAAVDNLLVLARNSLTGLRADYQTSDRYSGPIFLIICSSRVLL
jgi:hypothetical protein